MALARVGRNRARRGEVWGMRRSLILMVLLVSSLGVSPARAAEPSNDDPSGATAVSEFPATLDVDTTGATTGPFEEECWGQGFLVTAAYLPVNAVWYRLEFPSDAEGFVVTSDRSVDIVLWGQIATAPTGEPVLDRYSCMYPDDEWPYDVHSDVMYLSVGSALLGAAQQATIDVKIVDPDAQPPGLPNDVSYRATTIPSLPYSVDQDISRGDWEHDPEGCSSGEVAWYRYTSPEPTTLNFSVEALSYNEVSLSVYQLGSEVVTLGCQDGYDEKISVTSPVPAGVPILIGVGQYGDIRLTVEEVGGPPSDGADARADAVALAMNAPRSFDTSDATLEVGEPTSCGSGGSLWFSLPDRPRGTKVTATGGASIAAVAGNDVLACSTDGSLSIAGGSSATHVQLRGAALSGGVRIDFDPGFGIQVSADDSPFPSDCGDQSANSYLGSEVEVHQAVDPNDPLHILATWQQDRNPSRGGARGIGAAASFDGGVTWTRSTIPGVSQCSGGLFPRATDPWAAIDADGTTYVMSLGYETGPVDAGDLANLTNTVLLNRSTDGGLTWGAPIIVAVSPGVLFHDKETLTADPNTPGLLYAVWDIYPTNVAVPVFARSEDGGFTWTPPVPLPTTGSGAGDQIAVLDDGTLVEIANRSSVQSITSKDRGVTWSRVKSIGEGDHIEGPSGIRGGAYIPSVSTDGQSVFVSWSDTYGTFFARSDDAGASWSVTNVAEDWSARSRSTSAVAGDGQRVGVMSYVVDGDFTSRLVLATSTDGGATFTERTVTDTFDFSRAPYSSGRGYFLGDYFGLSMAGDDLLAAFAVTPRDAREGTSNVYSLRLPL